MRASHLWGFMSKRYISGLGCQSSGAFSTQTLMSKTGIQRCHLNPRFFDTFTVLTGKHIRYGCIFFKAAGCCFIKITLQLRCNIDHLMCGLKNSEFEEHLRRAASAMSMS